MLQEFRTFIARGNVLDLAVAVIIGTAFASIVGSLTDDIIMPLIGRVVGGLDFSGYFLRLGAVPEGYAGSLNDYGALKRAGVPLLGYGAFVTAIIKFLILAFIIFLLIKAANRALGLNVGQPPTPAEAAEIVLLREIRDELKARSNER